MNRGRRPFEAELRKIQKLPEPWVPIFVIVSKLLHADGLQASLDFACGRIWQTADNVEQLVGLQWEAHTMSSRTEPEVDALAVGLQCLGDRRAYGYLLV